MKMLRRDFLKTISVGLTSMAIPIPALARGLTNEKKFDESWRTVKIDNSLNVQNDSACKVYLPVPKSQSSYQELISTNWTGNYSKAGMIQDKKYGEQFFYAEWDKSGKKEMTLTYQVRLRNRINAETASRASVQLYLKPTKHVQLDGIVKETAQKIVKSERNPDKKARLIYDWIAENTFRDPNVRGCGFGDVKTLLLSGNLRGKCADLSSLFVGLCRATGVPAREVFGLRVLASDISKFIGKIGDVSSAQHCRAEYYSDQKGWIAVDPSDVRKVILEENLTLSDPRATDIQKKLFGAWEMNWIAYNSARDFTLPPAFAENINYLMYPLLVNGKTKNDGMEPDNFKYTIISKEIG